MTRGSTDPNVTRSSGRRKAMLKTAQAAVMTSELSAICCAALLLCFLSPAPRYWEQRIVPPVAIAAKIWMNSVLMASTRDTAEIAALPTRDTIMVSIIPISELRSCSAMRGQSSFLRSWSVKRRWSQSTAPTL